MTRLKERIWLRFERVPGCEWARSHVVAYDLWDVSLTPREFMAIDLHVQRCPACAKEYEDIRMVSEKLETLAKDLHPERFPEIDHKALTEKAWARCLEMEADSATRKARRTAFARRVAVPVAACLLILATPVLMYVGGWMGPEPVRDTASHSGITSDDGSEAPIQLAQADSKATEGKANSGAPMADDSCGLFDSIDKSIEATVLRAQVEATLPYTEEEYEAWAREEYPHVLWLYDVLTDLALEDPWQSGPIERYEESGQSDRIFTEASLGWRKLLIDSGELFKFDYPSNLEQPNCAPSIEGLYLAAAAAGYGLELAEDGALPLPQLAHAGHQFLRIPPRWYGSASFDRQDL